MATDTARNKICQTCNLFLHYCHDPHIVRAPMKGSRHRCLDYKAYQNNFDAIFRKAEPPLPDHEEPPTPDHEEPPTTGCGNHTDHEP